MERRQAMAVAAAGALVAAAAVAAGTSGLLQEVGDSAAGSLGFGAPAPVAGAADTTSTALEPVVITEVRDVYDTIVVGPARPAASPSSADPGPGAVPVPTSGSSGTGSPGVTATTEPDGPTTTSPGGSTTTTRPPGVPDDWPADEPIPPMPPGCQEPQLEDDGHWNCDH